MSETKEHGKHTPIPWRSDDWGAIAEVMGNECIALCANNHGADLAKGNAEFIVRAVNSHEELLEACKLALGVMPTKHGQGTIGDAMRAAIAKVEGRQ